MAAALEVNIRTGEVIGTAAVSADREEFKKTFRIMTGSALIDMYLEAMDYGNNAKRDTDGLSGGIQPGNAQVQPARRGIDCAAGIRTAV